MKLQYRYSTILFLVLLLVTHYCCAQTDVAGSVAGAFSGATISGTPQTGEVTQHASDSVGGLLEVRHIHNGLVGFEGAYSYHRANQTYSYTIPLNAPTPPCPSSGCSTQPVTVAISANAHAITGDWVVSWKKRSYQPFALAGGGVLIFVPSGSQKYTSTATKFVFVFGAGLDWKLASHFGLRLQDRVNLYSAPNLNTYAASTGAVTYMQEPAFGIYYRF